MTTEDIIFIVGAIFFMAIVKVVAYIVEDAQIMDEDEKFPDYSDKYGHLRK